MSQALSVVDQWKQFDLEGRRNKLDTQAQRISNGKERAISARRQLSSKTKEFRAQKTLNVDMFASLLKLYQGEIDQLTRRSKRAEEAFIELYGQLAVIADPAPALEARSQAPTHGSIALTEHEESARNAEVASLKQEVKNLKIQVARVSELEEEVLQVTQTASQSQKLAKEHHSSQMRSLQEQLDVKLNQIEAEKAAMRAELAKMRRTHDATQEELLRLRDSVNGGDDESSQLLQEASEERFALEQRVMEAEQELKRVRESQQDRREREMKLANQEILIAQLEEELQVHKPATAKCTELEERLAAAQQQSETLNEQLSESRAELNSAKTELSAALEHALQSPARVTSSVAPGWLEERAALKARLAETQKKLEETQITISNDMSSKLGVAEGAGNQDVMRLVVEQRERLRAQVLKLKGEVQSLRQRLAHLTEDNVSMFEKIQFLENFGGISRSSGSADIESDAFPAYKRVYEKQLDPFSNFLKKEKGKRINNLSAADRVTLQATTLFMSTRYSRIFILFYSIFLHLLVFGVLYSSALSSVK